ncbi:MAG TPA: MipA/OmpV family protein [Gammaproteobacteria bacterium]
MRGQRTLAVAALALGAAPGLALGADNGAEETTESPWRIGIAFGYGQRTNPLIQSDDITVLVDIDIAWFGERWFFDNGDVGRTLHDGERFTLNVIGRFNSDRIFFSKTDTEYVSLFSSAGFVSTDEALLSAPQPIEVPDRDYAFEVGLELLSDGDWGFLQAAVHHDASDKHGGSELYVNYGRSFRRQRWFVEPSVGVSWKSADLNDYYWGVRPHEASIWLPEYRAGAGANVEARIAASYQIDRHWAFHAAAQYERLSSEAAASPLVEERSVKSGFAGFSFRF